MSPVTKRRAVTVFLISQVPVFGLLGALLLVTPPAWTDTRATLFVFSVMPRAVWGGLFVAVAVIAGVGLYFERGLRPIHSHQKLIRTLLSVACGMWSIGLLLSLTQPSDTHNVIAWIPWMGMMFAHIGAGVVDERARHQLAGRRR